jgi:hypothetical protein
MVLGINKGSYVTALISLLQDYIRVCSPETFDFIYPSMWHGKKE